MKMVGTNEKQSFEDKCSSSTSTKTHTRRRCPAKCYNEEGVLQLEPPSTWLQLAAVFFLNALVAVPESGFGLFYDPLMETFDASRSAVGWSISVLLTSALLTGIFVSPFFVVFEARNVILVGASAMTAGMTLAACSPNLICFILFYGGIGGCGLGVLLLGGYTVVQHNFIYNRGLALGISTLGFTLGTITAPLFVEAFLERYALRGALLLHAGIIAQSIVFSLVCKLKEFPEAEQETNKDNDILGSGDIIKEDFSERGKYDELKPSESSNVDTVDNSVNTDINELSQLYLSNMETSEEKSAANCKNIDQLNAENILMTNILNDTSKTNLNCVIPLHSENKYKEYSQAASDQFSKDPLLISNNTNQKTAVSRSSRTSISSQTIVKPNIGTQIRENFKDFSVCTESRYVIFVCFCIMMVISRMFSVSHFPGAALKRGFTSRDAAHMFSILGVGNLVLRSVTTVLMNFRWLNVLLYNCIGIVSYTVACFLLIHAHSYLSFTAVAVLMGISEGICNTVMALIVVGLVGTDRFARAYSILNASIVPAPMIAAPLSGLLVDITGEYVLTFAVAGVSAVIGLMLMLSIQFITMKQARDEKKCKHHNDTES